MSGQDEEFEQWVREMAGRQPDVPESIIRTAAKGRLNRIRREQDRLDRIAGLAAEAGTTLAAAEAALVEHERRDGMAKWQAQLDLAKRAIDGADRPTPYAREKIPTVIACARALKRKTGRWSIKGTAKRAEVSRGALSSWIRRGWLNWPPA